MSDHPRAGPTLGSPTAGALQGPVPTGARRLRAAVNEGNALEEQLRRVARDLAGLHGEVERVRQGCRQGGRTDARGPARDVRTGPLERHGPPSTRRCSTCSRDPGTRRCGTWTASCSNCSSSGSYATRTWRPSRPSSRRPGARLRTLQRGFVAEPAAGPNHLAWPGRPMARDGQRHVDRGPPFGRVRRGAAPHAALGLGCAPAGTQARRGLVRSQPHSHAQRGGRVAAHGHRDAPPAARAAARAGRRPPAKAPARKSRAASTTRRSPRA